ncbi:hypothetical protein L7F22_053713 [Adiantum nelumboides]|nr:hypothetical protein [Adiantum nelumboides]
MDADLISTVNRLQETFSAIGGDSVDLPQCVVVGAQSSGRSSVLRRVTIGVLTKLDLMDNGTHALDILTGRVYPLKLGFIGVVNRSQQDIMVNLSMLAARKAEEEFFQNPCCLSEYRSPMRTKYLAKTLNQFARDFVNSIDGKTFDMSTKELCGGARIYYIFHDVFGHALDGITPTQNLTTQDIRTAIRNSTGPRPSLFVPEQAFELLIKPQIKLLEPPSLRCVELVYEELMKICHNCTSTELQRFPRLHAQVIEVVSELLRERLGPTSGLCAESHCYSGRLH